MHIAGARAGAGVAGAFCLAGETGVGIVLRRGAGKMLAVRARVERTPCRDMRMCPLGVAGIGTRCREIRYVVSPGKMGK